MVLLSEIETSNDCLAECQLSCQQNKDVRMGAHRYGFGERLMLLTSLEAGIKEDQQQISRCFHLPIQLRNLMYRGSRTFIILKNAPHQVSLKSRNQSL